MRIYEVLTAYRKIPKNPRAPQELQKGKCNIDFANDIFSFIRENNYPKLAAISFDIEGFFDNLDHKLIKEKWVEVMGFPGSLPKDHYNVFKNITKFSYVEEYDIFNEFRDSIFVRNKLGEIAQKKVDKVKYLKEKKAIAFCRKIDLGTLRAKNYIKANKYEYENGIRGRLRSRGVPQGAPISSVIANLYLIDFDKKIHDHVTRLGGIYRRYSDDLVVVLPAKHEKAMIKMIGEEMEKYKLNIQGKKTQIFWFIRCADRYYGFEKNQTTNQFQTNTTFEYLGFSFDGKYTLLRPASLAKYYRRMKRAIHRGKFYAKTTQNRSARGELFKSRLYKRFTHKGAQRRRKYQRDPSNSSQFIVTESYDWGNFLSYARKAQRTIPNNKIRSQTKRHWQIFHELIKDE